MQTSFNIYPNLKKTSTIVRGELQVAKYEPFQYAIISVVMFDVDEHAVGSRFFTLDKTNGFDEWKNDDTYLMNWIKIQIQKPQ